MYLRAIITNKYLTTAEIKVSLGVNIDNKTAKMQETATKHR